MCAILLAVALALTFAASFSAIIPILRLLISVEGLRTSLFRKAVEIRYQLDLQLYQPERHGIYPLQPMPEAAVVVSDVRAPQSGVRARDALCPPPDRDLDTPLALLEHLASSPDPPVVQVVSSSMAPDAAPGLAVLQPGPLDFKQRFALPALIWLARKAPLSNTPETRRQTLYYVFGGLFVMVLMSAAFRFSQEYLVIIISNRAVMDMRRHMYRTILHLPMTWFGRHLTETMSRVVTDFKDVERGYRALFGKLLTEPIKMIFLVLVALYLDWRITLFALVAAPVGVLLLSVLGRKIRKVNRKLLAGYARMMSVITAALAGMRVVRAYNMQTAERRRMWAAERGLLKQLLRIGRLEAMAGPLLEILAVLVAMGGVLYLAEDVFTGALSPDAFIALIVVLVVMFDAGRKTAEIYPRLARADAAAHRIFEMIDMPVEQHRTHGLPDLPPLQERIELRGVSFTYPGQNRPALQDVNLTVLKGQRVALVGPNGSGKTTLVSLLERFFEIDSGCILFDGHDIAQHSIASLRSQISLLTQDAVIFALTVFENIAYGAPGATLDDVIAAARRAHAHDFIERLPEGYQTVLGEFGATLSGGERQRLSLARAILRNAPIFIFDEATSQVDVDSERKIQAATREFMEGRTSLVIAHRIGTIIDSDLIAVFDRGQLVDAADHATLLERCALYSTLYNAHAQ